MHPKSQRSTSSRSYRGTIHLDTPAERLTVPEEIARNQRARLYGGMIESISQRGYVKTTVAHVISLAGVSRRAFYEQFANKEECFLATYDIIIARSRKLALEAWSHERGWANRLHASCEAFLDDIVADPKGARLVLIDALGVGSQARKRTLLVDAAFERLVFEAYKYAPNGVDLQRIFAVGAVGGVRQVIFGRLLAGNEHELPMLTDEVLDWIESYRSPSGEQVCVPTLMNARRPTSSPAEFLARNDTRARVLGAVIHLTLGKGYAEFTDPEIARFAGVSTEAFYQMFLNKEDCFLAVLDEFAKEVLDVASRSLETANNWPEGVCRAIAASIDYMVSHEALLHIAFIDLFEVGPAIAPRLTQPVEGLVERLTFHAPDPQRGSIIAQEAIVGALWTIILKHVTDERMRWLPHLVDPLSYTVLAPYIGPKAAVEAIQSARKSLRSI
jgi:AcrR family transcriptional regulator